MGIVLEKALDLASEQHGLFSIEQIKESGVNPDNVYQLASRNVFEKLSRGVFMVSAFPVSDLVDYMEAVLSIKDGGVIADESALELWNLSDVNPRKICVAAPRSYRIRKKSLEKYQIVKVDLDDTDIDEVSNIPTLIPKLAIQRSIENYLRGDLAEQAIDQALHRGYVTKREGARLRVQLEDREKDGR